MKFLKGFKNSSNRNLRLSNLIYFRFRFQNLRIYKFIDFRVEIVVLGNAIERGVKAVNDLLVGRYHVDLFAKMFLHSIYVVMVREVVEHSLDAVFHFVPGRNAVQPLGNRLLHCGDLVQDLGDVPLDGGDGLY